MRFADCGCVLEMILYDKRFSAFHYPVTDEDAPNYRSIIQNPMDVATLLQRVDSGHYITCPAFLQDVDLILSNAKAYNGDDYNGARIVSRAHELRDAVHGMLSQMDPALAAFCDKIAAQGGPNQMPADYVGSALHQTPVVQPISLTRASARLRNVQPDVNVDQSYEALKRPKKNVDAAPTAPTTEDNARHQESVLPSSTEELNPHANSTMEEVPENMSANCNEHDAPAEAQEHARGSSPKDDTTMADADASSSSQVEEIKQQFLVHTGGYGIPQLERLYTRILKGVFETKNLGGLDNPKSSVLQFLSNFSQDKSNF